MRPMSVLSAPRDNNNYYNYNNFVDISCSTHVLFSYVFKMERHIRLAACLFLLVVALCCAYDGDSVLLRDVQALTLHRGRYTAARRSSPVPHLQCVGGSAGCHAFVPEVVQCHNKGWDGVDVQWECKTDMDNGYRFGRIEVTCEGYSHPSDAYILKGSCGLEYTLELTKEGHRGNQGSWSSHKSGLGDAASGFFGSFFGKQDHHHHHQQPSHQSSHPSGDNDSGNLLVIVVLLLFAFGIYKLFLSGNDSHDGSDHDSNAGYHRDNSYGSTTGPPPPGFKPDYTGSAGSNPGYGFQTDYTQYQQYQGGRAANNTGGGFWTGMGTGGLLGYMFGRQRSQPLGGYSHHGYHSNTANYATRPSSSSGTRTASGFGGTKRR